MKFTPQQAIQFMTNISEKISDNFEQKPKMMIAIHRCFPEAVSGDTEATIGGVL